MSDLTINVKLSLEELNLILNAINVAVIKGNQAPLVAGIIDKVRKAGDTLYKKEEATKELQQAN